MRLLLDENVPIRLAAFITGHAVATVRDMRWLGIKNGKLIALAEGSFECLLTLDKGMKHQNDLRSLALAFVVVRCRSNRLGDLLPLLPEIQSGLARAVPGKVILVPVA